MPSTKSASKASEPKKTERLHLAESISNFSRKQESFLDAYHELKDYTSNIFTDLDLQIDTKQQELNELTKTYENRETDLKIECDQRFKEYQYDEALKVLKSRDEIAISEEELNKLKDDLRHLKEDYDDDLEDALEKERVKSKQAMAVAVSNADLKHKAEIAEIKAMSLQKQGEVEVLQETVENLKYEIREQRKLTQAVAEAAKSGAISQSFGKA